jgi:dolichol-phosphate mannosyltransferase
MWALTTMGMPYIWAAIIGAEVTIVGNFFLQERFVFGDMRPDARAVGARFAASFTFNNVEAALRIPIMALMVETWHISSVLATGLSLIVAFFARFLFHSLFVYAPRRGRSRADAATTVAETKPDTAAQRIIRAIDSEAMRPGEL